MKADSDFVKAHDVGTGRGSVTLLRLNLWTFQLVGSASLHIPVCIATAFLLNSLILRSINSWHSVGDS